LITTYIRDPSQRRSGTAQTKVRRLTSTVRWKMNGICIRTRGHILHVIRPAAYGDWLAVVKRFVVSDRSITWLMVMSENTEFSRRIAFENDFFPESCPGHDVKRPNRLAVDLPPSSTSGERSASRGWTAIFGILEFYSDAGRLI
jgi:hypothetical protein